MIDNRPILFFDSGIGGLTTLLECVKFLPNEHYFYFADESNMPYGDKPIEFLRRNFNLTMEKLIEENGPKMVVVACNTMTALSLSDVRKKYPEIGFVGTEPAVVPAIKSSKNPLLLCTQNTALYSKVVLLCKKYHKIECVCPKDFASLIENNFDNLENLKPYLTKLLLPYENRIDCVVLGCTHYIFCKGLIKEIVGESVEVLDGNKGISNRVKSCLEFFDNFGTFGGVRF